MRRNRLLHVVPTVLLTIPVILLATGSAGAATVTGHDPIGYLDLTTVSATGVSSAGWAADPDSSNAVAVTVSVDGVATSTVIANAARPDVARVYPALGGRRGFSATTAVRPGPHNVCWTAANIGAGGNSRLACRTVTINPPSTPPPPSVKPQPVPAPKPVPKPLPKPAPAPVPTKAPFGYVDLASYAGNAVRVSGWSIDPDTAASTRVDVTVNGAVIGGALANLSRVDVARAYPKSGALHGFNAVINRRLSPGNYRFCVVGKNTAAGPNAELGCRIVTVLPATEPAELGTAAAAAAARDLQAQAIASGAAVASAFPSNASSAARLAIAARALLQQATGRRAVPAPKKGSPAFVPSSPTKISDVQAVMGAKPILGSYPPARSGGRAGANRSLELFRNDPLTLSGSAGDGIVGAAAVLPANGTTVRPTLPGYPGGYARLRAEVALDNALSQLGKSYVWAAAGADTFDCSGLTQWAWGKAGVRLDHYTGSQAVQGVRVQANQLLPGDLVLFGGDLHHVGMYLGAGYMIDAPYTGSYVRINKISWYGDFTLAVRP